MEEFSNNKEKNYKLGTIISENGFNDILERQHYELDEKQKNKILEILQNKGCTYKDTLAIINGARRFKIITSNEQSFIQYNLQDLIKDHYNNVDIELYKRIDAAGQNIRKFYSDNNLGKKKLDHILKLCYEKAKLINKETNDNIQSYSDDFFKDFYILSAIYSSVAHNVPYKFIKNKEGEETRLADDIMEDIFESKTLNSILKKNTDVEFNKILEELRFGENIPESELFSKEEISKLLKHSLISVITSNSEKIKNVRSVLMEYIKSVRELYENIDNISEEDLKQLSKVTAKSVVLKCGKVLLNSELNIRFQTDFLLGKSIEEIKDIEEIKQENNSDFSNLTKLKDLAKLCPKLSIQDMDLNAHMYALTKNLTSPFAILNVSLLQKTCAFIIDSVYGAIGNKSDIKLENKKQILDKAGFKIETLFTKDNIFDIFENTMRKIINEYDSPKGNNDELKNNYVNNIKTLTSYLTPKGLHKLMSHNFNFFLQDNAILQDKLKNIFNEKNIKLSDLENFLNTEFQFDKKINDTSELKSSKSARKENTDKEDKEVEEDIDIELNKGQINIDIDDLVNKDVNLLGIDGNNELSNDSVDIESEEDIYDVYSDINNELNDIFEYSKCEKDDDFISKKIYGIGGILTSIGRGTIVGMDRDLNGFKRKLNTLNKKLNSIINDDKFPIHEKQVLLKNIKKVYEALEKRESIVQSDMEEYDKYTTEFYTTTTSDMNKDGKMITGDLDNFKKMLEKYGYTTKIEVEKSQNDGETETVRKQAGKKLEKLSDKKFELDAINLLENALKEFTELNNLKSYSFNKQQKETQLESSTKEIDAIKDKIEDIKKRIGQVNKQLRSAYSTIYKDYKDPETIIKENPYGIGLLQKREKLDKELNELIEELNELIEKLNINNDENSSML
ncbi:MAG: hypothetical protein ACI4L6_01500 [Candidatus Onthoplasma sp.]